MIRAFAHGPASIPYPTGRHNLLSGPACPRGTAVPLSDMKMSDKFERNPEQHDRAMNEAFPVYIERVMLRAIMARRLVPGTCLSEGRLAFAFGASRATVREALVRLQGRGLVHVVAKRGWFIPEQGCDEIRATCEARRIIQTGILTLTVPLSARDAASVRHHLARQHAALEDGDIIHTCFLLADFHVCLTRLIHNPAMTESMRSLMARSCLARATPTFHTARAVHAAHTAIMEAMGDGDMPRARALLLERIEASAVPPPHDSPHPPDLRAALAPVLYRIEREKALSSPAPISHRQSETQA
ncbi:GntR family transcriptional regulator [Gluconacetobacter entanii]|uniref:GntR family transcriptional regulator n=2 Tax=Gluconacetobacter entanii TaxID=108528 RepID=A0A318PZJ9_9PROT|nr:GntR family transcriptional regulator [Gluconacetobacter entanii]